MAVEKRIDVNALKVNQAAIVAFTLLGFVLEASFTGVGQWFVGGVMVALAVGTLHQTQGFRPLYAWALRPLGLVKPAPKPDDPAPHLFAQGLGAAFLLGSFLALVAGAGVLGWVLAWIVIALAFINLAFNFCAGCFVYYQLDRRGLMPHRQRR